MTCYAGAEYGLSLRKILSFWTGLTVVPPDGFTEGLEVKFLSPLEKFTLPQAHACFNIINIPVIHSNRDIFFSHMDRGIGGSIGHYGMV